MFKISLLLTNTVYSQLVCWTGRHNSFVSSQNTRDRTMMMKTSIYLFQEKTSLIFYLTKFKVHFKIDLRTRSVAQFLPITLQSEVAKTSSGFSSESIFCVFVKFFAKTIDLCQSKMLLEAVIGSPIDLLTSYQDISTNLVEFSLK